MGVRSGLVLLVAKPLGFWLGGVVGVSCVWWGVCLGQRPRLGGPVRLIPPGGPLVCVSACVERVPASGPGWAGRHGAFRQGGRRVCVFILTKVHSLPQDYA